jgi:pimeloyl-ACP methyl ester carboxylesterase
MSKAARSRLASSGRAARRYKICCRQCPASAALLPASPLRSSLRPPPTPPFPTPSKSGLADINQTRIFFAQFGKGQPVLLLHGGSGSSDYWGYQIRELQKQYLVVVMDTRGDGRSPVTKSYSFELFANNVSALLDFLGLSSVAVIGWSDGAITGLQLALNHDKRVSKLFAFGANATLDGGIPGGSRNKVFVSYV